MNVENLDYFLLPNDAYSAWEESAKNVNTTSNPQWIDEEYENFVQKMRKKYYDKQADYVGNKAGFDRFANLRLGAEMAGNSLPQHILGRLTDKLSRASTLLKRINFKRHVDDETFEDTCIDGANYNIMMALAYQEVKPN